MNALPFLSAADASPATAIYVIAAGVVCTGLGWWLRARVGAAGNDGAANASDASPLQPVATPPDASPAEEARREREELTARCEALGTKVAELERDARDSAAALAAAQASAATAKAEAAALAAGRSDSEVLAALREEIEAQQSVSAALIAEKAALEQELKQRTEEMAALIPAERLAAAEAELARLRGEWERQIEDLNGARKSAEAAWAAEKATLEQTLQQRTAEMAAMIPAARLEAAEAEAARQREDLQRRVEELTVALAQAREASAVAAVPSTEPSPAIAQSGNAPLAALKEELEAAKKEITTLKRELSAPKPRPILTSPRPGGNTGAVG